MHHAVISAGLLAMAAASVAADPATSRVDACRREVIELHQFFQDWFTGTIANEPASFARFADVMSSDFEIIGPSGNHVRRAALIEQLRAGYAVHAKKAFSISVENVQVRMLTTDLALVTYEEWQTKGETRDARRSSALLRSQDGTPNGWVWVHVHETWMDVAGDA